MIWRALSSTFCYNSRKRQTYTIARRALDDIWFETLRLLREQFGRTKRERVTIERLSELLKNLMISKTSGARYRYLCMKIDD